VIFFGMFGLALARGDGFALPDRAKAFEWRRASLQSVVSRRGAIVDVTLHASLRQPAICAGHPDMKPDRARRRQHPCRSFLEGGTAAGDDKGRSKTCLYRPSVDAWWPRLDLD
jgi:hypothetical protein